MRYVSLAAVAVSFLVPVATFAQSSGFFITNYQLVTSQQQTITSAYNTYRADLVNNGGALAAVTAVARTTTASAQVAPGQGTLHFAPVPANATVHSSNTFTLLVDTTVPLDFAGIQWSFDGPAANAGPSQTAKIGTTVTLNGSNSTNPSGLGTITYSWAFQSRPPSSTATLTGANTVNPTFVIDAKGTYVVILTVSNGSGSDAAQVIVTTVNSPPVAVAGPNQTVSTGGTAFLDGSASSDIDGNALNYKWSMVSLPGGSTAALNAPNYFKPRFNVDLPGVYVVQLIVNDGQYDSVPSTVTISTQNTPPVAKAGANQTVPVGSLVQLNGSGSTDVNGDALTYKWSILSSPSGSAAVLSSTTAINPTFTADLAGTYVVQLIANDGKANSTPAVVTITTSGPQPPTANAGPNQTVGHQVTVTLAGSGTDTQSLPLTYQWSLTTVPPGSAAVLSGPTTQGPTFFADLPGSYIAQLVVNNGTASSVPATVTITTTNTAPVAKAGSNQSPNVGDTVLLDGVGSVDADSDPLTYSWTFTVRPNGSAATLAGANSRTPSFTADVAGSFVVQLIVNDGFTNSTPVTVMITAGGAAISLTPNPLNLTTATGTLSVMLTAPAGSSGQVVNLSSNNPSTASLPATVTVPANSTGANVTVTPGTPGTAVITGSASGFTSGTSTVAVTAAPAGIILPTNAIVVGPGASVAFPVKLASPPATTVIVTLSSSATSKATISPVNISFPAGSVTPTATPQITGVDYGTTTITATAPTYTTVTKQVTVATSLTLSPTTLSIPLQTAQILTATLSSPAGANGVTLNVTSDDQAKVSTPSTVTIPAGNTTVSFRVTGFGAGTTTVRASSLPTVAEATSAITVVAPGAITLQPNLIVNPNKFVTFPVTLTVPAPAGGLTVTLSESETNPILVDVAPKTIFIPAGATTPAVQPTIEGRDFGHSWITATAPGYTEASVVTICTEGSALKMGASVNVGIGSSAPLTISLQDPAPGGGVTVNFVVSDGTKASVSPTSIFFAAGTTTSATIPMVTGISTGSTNINGVAPGYAGAITGVFISQSAISFSPPTLTIAGTGTQNLTLTSSTAAPASGLTLTITSSNTSVATVPSQVTIPANATSVQVPVTAIASGSTTILASGVSLPSASASVTVTGVGGGGITVGSASVTLGQSKSLNITLPSAAPSGGVTVALSSSDTSKVTVSSPSVFIAANSLQPATQPQVTGVNLGSATITASAVNFTSGTASVSVTGSIAFSPNTLSINGVVAGTLNLTLSGPAPAGGIAVNLSSSNISVATVPASITFTAGSTSVSVPVTSLSVGTTTIHASNANLADTTATVTIATTGGIIVPASTNVGPGQTALFPVSLSSPAAVATIVSLTPSDATTVTISPSAVFIAAGNTQPSAPPQVSGVKLGSGTITASANGIGSATGTVVVKLTMNFQPSTMTVSGTQNIVLGLSQPAPTGGLIVNLNSDNTAIATVPATVSIPANQNAILVPVTATGQGSTAIHASGTGLTTANATINAAAPLSITTTSLPAGQVNVAYSQTLAATGGAGPYTWSIISGTLPSPLQLNGAVISGTPTAAASNVALTVKVTDSSSPAKSVTANLTLSITAAPTVSLTLTSGSGQTANTGAAFSNPLVVTAKDSSNNLVSGINVTFTSVGSGAGIVSKTVATVAGVASANVIANGTAGPFTVTASAPGTNSVSFSLTNSTAGVPSITATGGATQTAQINKPFALAFSATVKDASGNPVSGAVVTFAAPASAASGTFAGGSNTATTNASGIAISAIFTANGTAGSYPVVASTPSVSSTASFSLTNTNTSTGNTITVVSGSPQSIKYGTTFAPLVALVTDSNGNPVKAIGVTFSGPSNGPGITSNQIRSTDASGMASYTPTANSLVGPYTVNASVAQASTPAAFSLTNTAGPAANITAVSGSSQSAITNNAFPSQLVVNVTDSNNNPVSGAVVTFKSNGTLAGIATATATTDATGTARATVTANSTSGSFTVLASTLGPLSQATFTLTNKNPPPASVTVTGGSPQSAPVSTTFATPMTVVVADASSNPIGGITVIFNPPTSGPSGTFPGGTSSAVTNPQGIATVPAFKANATQGSYNLTAVVSGVSTPATFALTNTAPPPGSIVASSGGGQTTPVNNPFANQLLAFVRDTNSTAVAGVTVTFAVPGSGPSATFAGGVSTAVTNASGLATSPVLIANGQPGTFTVQASVAGLPPVTYSLTSCNCVPAQIQTSGGASQITQISTDFPQPLSVTVRDANGVAVKGITVTFTAPPSTGASVTFAGGKNTAITNASGVAVSNVITANANTGTFSVIASVPGLAGTAKFSLANSLGPVIGLLSMSNLSVGKDLEGQLTVGLTTAAPVGGVQVTLTTSDPTLALVAARTPDAGKSTITFTIKEGNTQLGGLWVQGLAAAGTVTLTATADGWGGASATVTLTPSGFQLAGPSGANLTLSQGADPANLTVSSYRLDSSLVPAEPQPVRGGTFSVTANVSIVGNGVGSILSSPVTLNGGDSSTTTQYDPGTTPGSSTLIVGAPAGFSIPASGNTVNVTVTPNAMTGGSATVGMSLENSTQITLNGVAPFGGLPITITSNDPSKFLLSKNATDSGSASITVNAPTDFSVSPPFYVYGVASGSATYTATSNFGSATGNITIVPSAAIMSGPGAIGQSSFSTTPAAANTSITVYTVMMDGHFTQQNVAGGKSVNIPVTSSDSTIGTITSSPVNIAPGTLQGFTAFHPVAAGTATISVGVPTGFTSPGAFNFLSAVVSQPGISLNAGSTLGQNLQQPVTVTLGQAAPSGGVLVSLTSNSSTLKLANDPAAAGQTTTTLTIPSGQITGTVYASGTASSGTVSFSASASGYNPRTASLVLVPSGVVLTGPAGDLGAQAPDSTTVNTATTVSPHTAQLDPSTGKFVSYQALAGGLSLTVNLTVSGVGSVPSSAVIAGGADHSDVSYTSSTAGNALVTVSTSGGIVTRASANDTSVNLSVH